jgi:multicomponent Na+:H+ antiporter subunit G
MRVLLTAFFTLSGAFFMLVAGVGLIRMPDLLMRMHAATKAGTLGAGLMLLAVAIHFGTTGVTIRAVATILFLFFTAPVAAHVIGRAAYFSGWLELWKETRIDELRDADEPSEKPEA